MPNTSFASAFFASIFMLTASSAFATDPGTPMNCTDLVLGPGLSCSQLSNPAQVDAFFHPNSVLDNDGQIINKGQGSIIDIIRELGPCGSFTFTEMALLYRNEPGRARVPIVSVNQRCLNPGTSTIEGIQIPGIMFDALRGDLIVQLNSYCSPGGISCTNYGGGQWIARISGFTPLADVLPQPPQPPPPPPLCNNGVDDDGDGAIDMNDNHCKSLYDNDESRP